MRVPIISTRHGEKLHETLATREELARADEQGDFCRVALDTCDMNYGQPFDKGDKETTHADDYRSHNTTRLGGEEAKNVLRALPIFAKLFGHTAV